MKTIQANMGPGTLQTPSGSPFAIPIQQWNNISVFLANVNGTSAASLANFISVIPAFADLKKCAADWQGGTYANLIGLAKSISQYGTNTATVVYPQLDTMLNQWTNGNPSASQQTAFSQLLQPTVDAAKRHGQLAATLASQLQALATAVELTNAELPGAISNLMAQAMSDPSGDSGDLANRLVDQVTAISQQLGQLASLLAAVGTTPPVQDIQRVEGAWSAIANDLGNLYSAVLSQIASEEPFIADLDLQVAIGEWKDVASEAQAFANSARTSAAPA